MNCDIIIPVWNQLKLTKDCIEYIKKNTNYPYRLIIIDNGSERETKGYLEKLSKDNELQIKLVRNEENLGYVKAVNQGLKASDADYLCLLNNDTKVGEGWLEELIRVAESDPRIGIVNPGGSIQSYKNKELSGKWIEIGFATGFCMLIEREVIDKIGFFDETYDIGFFEDTDFCKRAKMKGYICVSAKASYVFHYAHRSFDIFVKDKVNELFDRNRDIFYTKWGRILRIAYVILKKDLDDKLENDLLELARQGHMVYLFLKSSAKKIKTEHGNIREFRYPDFFFSLLTLMKILRRKKKGFDKVFTDNPKFAHRLQNFTSDLKIIIVDISKKE